MYRKIQLVGGKTYSINLPIHWIKRLKLEKKSNLLITELDNGNLLISSPSTIKYSKESIKKPEIIASDSDSLSRDITRAYLLGFEHIIIKSNSSVGFIGKELEDIEDSISRFPGAEIMSEGKSTITIEIIASFEKNNPYKLIHRIFNLTQDMLERIFHIFDPSKITKDTDFREEIRQIQNIDKKVNRTYFLIVRQLRRAIQDPVLRDNLKIKTLRIMDFRLISHLLENIGDYCVTICRHLLEFQNIILPYIIEQIDPDKIKEKEEIYDRMVHVSKRVREIHQDIFDSFRNEDEVTAAKIITDTISFQNGLNQFVEDLKLFPKKSGLSIIMYRFYDIFSMLIDICDLITREEVQNNTK